MSQHSLWQKYVKAVTMAIKHPNLENKRRAEQAERKWRDGKRLPASNERRWHRNYGFIGLQE